MDGVIIRQAIPEDIPFLAKTIVEAEKSGTEHAIMAKYFGISDEELRMYMEKALEEGVEGCDISLSGFIVAEYNGVPISTQGGWMEGCNDGMPSEILKTNLLMHTFPREIILRTRENAEIAKDLHIERKMGTYQFEFSYTEPEFRGQHLVPMCIHEHLKRAVNLYHAKMAQCHPLEINIKSIRAKERGGFHIVKRFVSNNPRILEIYPSNTMLLMEMDLSNLVFEDKSYLPLGQVNP